MPYLNPTIYLEVYIGNKTEGGEARLTAGNEFAGIDYNIDLEELKPIGPPREMPFNKGGEYLENNEWRENGRRTFHEHVGITFKNRVTYVGNEANAFAMISTESQLHAKGNDVRDCFLLQFYRIDKLDDKLNAISEEISK
jgi:hypothetical protein